MRRAALAAALALALAGAPARAGTYDVVSCAAAPGGANNAWAQSNTAPESLSAAAACPPGAGHYDGLRVYDVLGSANAPAGARAEWAFAAPAGTRIVRWRYQRYLGKDGTNSWHVYARLGDGTVLDTCSIPLGAPSCHAGAPGYGTPGALRDAGGLDTDRLAIGVECAASGGTTCATGGLSIHNVWAALYSSTVTLSEATPPALGAASGPLLEPGWQAGTRAVSFGAGDGVGIAETRVYVDGAARSTAAHPCDFTRPIPCADVAEATHAIDTMALADGERALVVAAVDAAGNERRSAAVALLVDNLAPQPWILAPAGTTTSDQLYVSWGASDAGAGVDGYDVEVEVDGGGFATWLAATRATGATYRAEAGRSYRFRVRAHDGTGKSAAVASDAVSVVAAAAPPPPPAGGGGGGGDGPPPTPGAGGEGGDEPAAVRSSARLAVRSARIVRGRLVVEGTLARAATGRVVVSLRRLGGGRVLAARRALPRRGRFRAVVPLRGAARRGGRLTVRYAGDARHRPVTARLTIRVR